MSYDPIGLEGLVLLVTSISLAFTLLLSLLQCYLSPEERDLNEKSHLGFSIPMSLTLWIISGCVSLHLFQLVG